MLAAEIEKTVSEILLLKNQGVQSEILDEKFKTFKDSNTLLYEMVLSKDMNMEIFKKMMNMKRKLEDGEDQYSVDVKFGKFMAEKYIDPVIKK